MTDYKITPLTWLDTKYSSINHNHELYEEIPIKFTYEDDTEETIKFIRSLR